MKQIGIVILNIIESHLYQPAKLILKYTNIKGVLLFYFVKQSKTVDSWHSDGCIDSFAEKKGKTPLTKVQNRYIV